VPKKLKVKVRCPEEECYVRAKSRAEAEGEKFKPSSPASSVAVDRGQHPLDRDAQACVGSRNLYVGWEEACDSRLR
jgi:hypothetical protein